MMKGLIDQRLMIAVNGLEDGSISVSLFLCLLPFSHTQLLSHSDLSLSLRACLCHPLSLVSSWQPINGVPLSPLMAQLLALMHFKHTAAATSQSEGRYTSSSNLHNLCSFFCTIVSPFQRVALRVNHMHQRSSSAVTI